MISILRKIVIPLIAFIFLAGCSSPTPTPQTSLVQPIVVQTISVAPIQPTTTSTTVTTTITTPTAPVTTSTTQPVILSVYFLDVGQGDSEIIRYGDKTVLIDAGTNLSTNALLADIKSLGITKFDIIIATHPHEDHIGGLDAVINNYDFGTIFMPKVSTTTKTFLDVIHAITNKGKTATVPVPGSTFNLGDAQGTFLAPNMTSYQDINNYSIVLRLVYKNTSFLFTGDAQVDSENEMLSRGYDLKADVLKVGHHGSDTSTSQNFLKAVSPKYAIIEVGAGNTYHHPHPITMQRLANAGVKVYRTDLNGSIVVTSDGSNLTFKTVK